jgi:hypothetical protein
MNLADMHGDPETALHLVLDEFEKARRKFPAFNSGHEGWAVLREEVDELWDEVKKREPDPDKLRHEAIQVAAMALRFVVEVTGT